MSPQIVTGASIFCTFDSSTKISMALLQSSLTSDSVRTSHRLRVSIILSRSEVAIVASFRSTQTTTEYALNAARLRFDPPLPNPPEMHPGNAHGTAPPSHVSGFALEFLLVGSAKPSCHPPHPRVSSDATRNPHRVLGAELRCPTQCPAILDFWHVSFR